MSKYITSLKTANLTSSNQTNLNTVTASGIISCGNGVSGTIQSTSQTGVLNIIAPTVSVQGNLSASSVTSATYNATAGMSLTAANDQTISSTSGNISISAPAATKTVTISSAGNCSLNTVTVSSAGNTNIPGTLTVVGGSTLNNLTIPVNKTLTVSGNLVCNGQIQSGVVEITTNTSITSSHNIISIKTNGSSVTATLPLASSSAGMTFTIMKSMTADANSAIVTCSGSDKIDNSITSYTFGANGDKLVVYSDGVSANWWTV